MPSRSPSHAITPEAALRRAYARDIAAAYTGDRRVAAVLLGGSSARGHADRYSDIELSVMWTEAPTDAARTGAISAAGGDLVRLYPVADEAPGPVWSDAWKVGRKDGVPFTGVEVDMQHLLAETVEESLRHVLEDFDPDPSKQNLVSGIHCGIALHGRDLVEDWQRQAAAYPDELRLAVVRAHAQIEWLWRLDSYSDRGNPVAGYRLLTSIHEELLHTLLGLNRVYYSGFRSLEAVTCDLLISPSDLLERIRASYPLEAGGSRKVLTALVEETYDLIEEHLPAIDVERLREILRYERPLWE